MRAPRVRPALVALTCVSDDTLAGTLCRCSSLQSTVLAWWYTDCGVYQGLVSHTHCRGHSTAPPAGHDALLAGIHTIRVSSGPLNKNGKALFCWNVCFCLPGVAPPTPEHIDDVTEEKRRTNCSVNPMVHWGQSRVNEVVKLWRPLPANGQREALTSTAGRKHTHRMFVIIWFLVQI